MTLCSDSYSAASHPHEMISPTPEEVSADEEENVSARPQRPPRARTILDLKDRIPQTFQPFITFDFEPDDISSDSRDRGRSQPGHRRSRASSRVAIDHFDREGVEHLRSRFSSASEYSTYLTESRSNASTNTSTRRDDRVSQRSPGNRRKCRKDCREDMTKPRQTVNGSSSVTCKMKSLYVDKRLAPFDLEMALRETIKQHGSPNTPRRTLGLGFRDMSVFGADRSLSSGTVFQPTLWSTLNPLEWTRRLLRLRNRVSRKVISGFEGVVKPGEMLLVLGRPGSGCTTLLKVLANQTREFVHVLGDRRYDAFTPQEVGASYRDSFWYCSEAGSHLTSLTVRQTISFAARSQRYDSREASDSAEEVAVTLMTIFGLRHVKDLLMDNDKISQAERRRVSICEALAARSSVCCWDKPAQGLDACAALEFAQALRIATDLSAMTTMVTLSQAGEALYQLFDKVCVIAEGRMLYYGGADAARGYFIDLGYDPLPRQATSDFLINVTDRHGRIQNPGRPFSAPRTSEEFTRAFHRSPSGRANRLEVANYWQDNVDRASYSERLTKVRLPKEKNYMIFRTCVSSWTHHLSGAISRKYRMMKNHWTLMLIQILLSVLQGVFAGLAYWHPPEVTGSSVLRDGVLFIILLFSMLSTMVESLELEPNQLNALRQFHSNLSQPSTEAVATVIFDILTTFLSQSSLSILVYALAGLRANAFYFLTFLLFIVTTALTMKLLFRSVALLTTKEAGYSIAGSMIVLLLLFSRFINLSPSVKGLSQWMTWLDPLSYTLEGLVVNEYHDVEIPCTTYSPQGADYAIASPLAQTCLMAALTDEDISLGGDEYFGTTYEYSYYNLWINFCFVLAFMVALFGVFLLASEFHSPAFLAPFTLFKRGTQEQETKDDRPDLYRHIRRDRRAPEGEGDEQYEVPLNDVFAWKNLHYAIPQQREQRVLLDGISGYVAPRKLCALVGQHGVGKTTLLNVLAGRDEQGVLSGDLHLNGTCLSSAFQSQVGFCQHTETHYPRQTVREALRFSADLRQPPSAPAHEKEAYVESCLKMCRLEAHADAMICTLSLADRKRASIGVELAAQPRLLLFLDEPTSGLDPQEALAIIALLRDLANHGQAVLCSTHHPSSEILAHCDQMLVLHKGGKMVYFGDVGDDCETVIDYFERNGARPCESTENPIEWMMNVISADDHAYIPVDWHGKWLRSPEIARLRLDIDEFQRKSQQCKTISKPGSGQRFMASWPLQTFVLLKRTFLAYWRSPGYLLAKLSLNLVSGLFIGFTFFQSDNSLHGVQRKIFATFLLSIICIPMSIQLQTMAIDTRSVYELNERHKRMYSWIVFLGSHLAVELFWNILSSVLFFSAWYFATGFPVDRFVYSLLVIGFAYPLYYTTQALAIASPSSSTRVSSFLFCLSFSFTGIFDGVTHSSEHALWQTWLYGTSPMSYLLEAFIGQALGHQQIECSPTELFQLVSPSSQACLDYLESFIDKFGGYVDNPNSTDICQYCPARTTDEFLVSRYNIKYEHRWRNVWIVLAACLLNILLMFALTYVFRIRRGRLSGRRKQT